ncbi:hypothetical protein BT63DRAFT_279988 [Microthyrium microscopicum]|uniref:Uncharacterized protein n=1 Tax=Microthyrium microscopicum TaxID=703497 RepID=A0A6A6U9B3_9PEZI|nr:hypothetical protein BT63DRAFT_279988 [Microthyrium microscopicum]
MAMATKRGLEDELPFPRQGSSETRTASKSNISPSSRSRANSQGILSQNDSKFPRPGNNGNLGPTCTNSSSFAPDASIVLIGIRGTGKSSLAIIASSALGFRVIDADRHFFQITGLSRAAFNARHGVREYRRRELQIMRSVLLDNQIRCVITCGPGSVQGEGQNLLVEYSKTHPVINILRDTDEIQRYLSSWDKKTISDLVELTAPSYRASSGFEFYNISESPSYGLEELAVSKYPPTLTLKNLQQDFLQFVYKVIKQPSCNYEIEAGDPISSIAPESKQYTYALEIQFSALMSFGTELRDLKSTADAIEFVVDLPLFSHGKSTFCSSVANNISRQFYLIRRYTQIPIIFHVPPIKSHLHITSRVIDADQIEAAYLELLRFGLRLSPEYLSIDITCNDQRIRDVIATRCSTKVIGHFCDTEPGPDGWVSHDRKQKLRLAEELGCDLVRICQEAASMLDNISLQRFVHEIKTSKLATQPLIAYNTGPLGRMSCWQNPTLTPVTNSLLRSLDPRGSSNWLLTIQEAQNALYASFTLDKMYFGVLGANVSSSLSPAMHNAAYRFCGMPHEYKIFQYSSLKEMEHVFRDPYFGGASITAPFKREMTLFVDYMSAEARVIGAVNTLVPLRAKTLASLLDRSQAGPIVAFYGECTDWIGIHTCASRNLSPVNTVNERTTALVLGAGGMARAAVYALIRLGVRNILIHNRTLKKAQEVANHFTDWSSRDATTGSISDWDAFVKTVANGASHFERRPDIEVVKSLNDTPQFSTSPTIIISTLPGHNAGQSIPINNTIPSSWISSQTGGVVLELAYTPLQTPLLQQFSAESHRGWIVVNGLQVLPEYGAPQFELFTGRKAPRQLMSAAAMSGYEEQQNH